jgi:hypothetical protein
MRVRISAAPMVARLLASPVAAQDVRGGIEGIVKDSSGAGLPSAVETKSPTLAGPTTASDQTGTYRFPAVCTTSFFIFFSGGVRC